MLRHDACGSVIGWPRNQQGRKPSRTNWVSVVGPRQDGVLFSKFSNTILETCISQN